MTEKPKYKVGDKVLIEVEIDEVDWGVSPYRLTSLGGNFLAWVSEDALEKSLVSLPPRPKITQAVMDWYEKDYPNGEEKTIDEILDKFANTAPIDSDVAKWLFHHTCDSPELNKRQHALATLIAYGPEAVEVEKETKYKVTLKPTGQTLSYDSGMKICFTRAFADLFTKQELIDTGFEGVFDNQMFELEEVD